MRHYRFVQLDVFTETPFCGNPLAVFPDAEGLRDEEMQAIAREMNLSETVFVLPSRDARALRRLRIFTPAHELPFAGHPVVGTWNLLAREEAGGIVPVPEGGTGRARIEHELGIGVLPVDIEFKDGTPVRVVMTQGEFRILRTVDGEGARREIAASLGLEFEDLDERLPMQIVSTGIPFLAVPIRTLDALRRCQVESTGLTRAYTRYGATGCSVFTRETMDNSPSALHTRMFAPGDGIAEDPATGSAAGALGAYLVHHGALREDALEADALKVDEAATLTTHQFVIEQGDLIKRSSRISIEVESEAVNTKSVRAVRVGGGSVVVAHGRLMF